MFNNVIFTKKIFSEEVCQTIIDFGISQCTKNIPTIVNNENISDEAGWGTVDTNIRDVTIYSPPRSEEGRLPVLQHIVPPLYESNEKYYKFDLSDHFEFEILKYEVGGHYTIHCDVGHTILHPHISTRKLSFSFILNGDFEGGDLEFPGLPHSAFSYHKANPPCLKEGITLEKGDSIFFPSYFYHKVRPVTSGTRWVLVGWIHGDKPLR